MFNRTKSNGDMDAWVQERLSEYLDGTLSPNERARVEAQLAQSERARKSLEDLRWTVSLLKQTPAPPLPRQFTLPITQRAPRSAPGWMGWGARTIAAAAVIVVVALVGVNLLRQPNGALDSTAMAPAQVPVAAQPSARVALQATPAPTLSAPQAAPKANGIAPTPFMITVQPPPETPAPLPLTATPERKLAPAQSTSAAAANAAPATSAPAATSAPFLAQDVAPSQTPVISAASAAGGNAPESSTVNGTSTAPVSQPRGPGVPPVYGIIVTAQLKIREGPGTEYRSIGGLNRGDRVSVVGRNQNAGWLYIQFSGNRRVGQGWIARSFVALDASVDTLPVLLPPDWATPTPTNTPTPTATPTETPTPESLEQGWTPTPEPPTVMPTETPPEQGPLTPGAAAEATSVPTNAQPAVSPTGDATAATERNGAKTPPSR